MCGLGACLRVLFGAFVAEARVQPLAVVPDLDVFEDLVFGLLACLEDLSFKPIHLATSLSIPLCYSQ